MRSILKALGVTIWGVIAFGLLAIFIFVGYEAALKYRSSGGVADTEKAANTQAGQPQAPPLNDSINSADLAHIPVAPVLPRSPDATRKLLLSAVQGRQYDSVIQYGQELVDGQSAGPADLSAVAQSYFAISDCANAARWAEKAKEAFQRASRVPDADLERIAACCDSSSRKPRVALDSAQRARLDRLLSSTEAARSESGIQFVRLAELYFGYGEYELAIASIERGLNKGHLSRLEEEAYVYLGRSEVAIGDLDAARDAFAKLKGVPGVSPNVLRLWTLYAETQLLSSKVRSTLDGTECKRAGIGGL